MTKAKKFEFKLLVDDRNFIKIKVDKFDSIEKTIKELGRKFK